jgi:hypothetical protein
MRERGGLVDHLGVEPVVHPDRRCVDHPPEFHAARRFEHVKGSSRVDFLGPDGIEGGLVDVRDGREVQDGVAAAHGVAERVAVSEVAEVGVDRSVRVERRGDHVEDARPVSHVDEGIDDV